MDPQQKAKQEAYQKLVKEHSPKPNAWKNVMWAFLIGGAICVLGQLMLDIFTKLERTETEAAAATLAAMIFLGAVATGLGFYDDLAEIGGAGTAVPITGFANTVVAAAMEFRREGIILGMGSKMFVIAGPVLVFGILSGFIVTLIRALLTGLF